MSCDVDRDPDAISKNEGEEGGGGSAPPKSLFSVQPVFFATYKKTLKTNISYKYVIFKYCFECFFVSRKENGLNRK